MKYAVTILFLTAGIAIAADDAESKKLLKELEGTYKIISMEKSGETMPAKSLDVFGNVLIKGDKFSTTRKGNDGKMEMRTATIAVDATQKPAHFDGKRDDGPKKDETSLGIIVIEGETIKICVNADDKMRPTEFKSSKENMNGLITLKKIKE
jgi:uncharacterized protein (TIGR03067 family)